MKRTPLARKTPLKRGGNLKRSEWKPRRRKADIPASVRRQVAKRSQRRCEAATPICNGRAEHMHHVLMRSQGGNHGAAGLLHVSHLCHRWIHEHPAESYEHGWLRHAWETDRPDSSVSDGD